MTCALPALLLCNLRLSALANSAALPCPHVHSVGIFWNPNLVVEGALAAALYWSPWKRLKRLFPAPIIMFLAGELPWDASRVPFGPVHQLVRCSPAHITAWRQRQSGRCPYSNYNLLVASQSTPCGQRAITQTLCEHPTGLLTVFT